KGCGLVAPAFTDVRAARLLAHGVEVLLAHQALQPQVVGITRRFDFDPVGMTARHVNPVEDGRSRIIEDRDLRSSILYPRFFRFQSNRIRRRSCGEIDLAPRRNFARRPLLLPWTSRPPKSNRRE